MHLLQRESVPLVSAVHPNSIANIALPSIGRAEYSHALTIKPNDTLPNDHHHKSRLICTGGSCTGNSIMHSLTKGHKGVNTVLFELDNNVLERSLL